MLRKIASLPILLTIAIIVIMPQAHATDPPQQKNKTLVSLTHSGNDPVGFMLYTLVKHEISISDDFHLAYETEIPIIWLELITFDPDAADTEYKAISTGYSAIWTSTEGYHINAAAGVSGRDRLKPVANDIVAKTKEIIPNAQQYNKKSAEAGLRHIVGIDLLRENDVLRDRIAELQDKVNALEMELARFKNKSWWQRWWGD